jgi:predicted alpha/beta-hydrolase family hydrolase
MSAVFSASAAVLAPGYGGTAEQPIVRAMAARLASDGLRALPITFSRRKPTDPFTAELDDVRRARAQILAEGAEHVVLIGRSFGGRMCARLAAHEPPRALVLLGHPIAPEGRPRPDDEAALEAVRCPTLVVQGERDRLGPLDVLRRIAQVNRNVDIYVLRGVGHNFGPRQAEGIEHAARWLRETLTS